MCAVLRFAIFHLRFCCGFKHSQIYMEIWILNNLEQYFVFFFTKWSFDQLTQYDDIFSSSLKVIIISQGIIKWSVLCLDVYFSSSSSESGDVNRWCCVLGGVAEVWYVSFCRTSKVDYASASMCRADLRFKKKKKKLFFHFYIGYSNCLKIKLSVRLQKQ